MTTTQPDRDTILRQFDDEPAAGLLAAADLRERRASAATPGPWHSDGHDDSEDAGCYILGGGVPGSAEEHGLAFTTAFTNRRCCADAEHIAAEAAPAHALAEAALWRRLAGRHEPLGEAPKQCCRKCFNDPWPCPDLLVAVAAARAYITGCAQ